MRLAGPFGGGSPVSGGGDGGSGERGGGVGVSEDSIEPSPEAVGAALNENTDDGEMESDNDDAQPLATAAKRKREEKRKREDEHEHQCKKWKDLCQKNDEIKIGGIIQYQGRRGEVQPNGFIKCTEGNHTVGKEYQNPFEFAMAMACTPGKLVSRDMMRKIQYVGSAGKVKSLYSFLQGPEDSAKKKENKMKKEALEKGAREKEAREKAAREAEENARAAAAELAAAEAAKAAALKKKADEVVLALRVARRAAARWVRSVHGLAACTDHRRRGLLYFRVPSHVVLRC